MIQMMERAIDHEGFSVIECLRNASSFSRARSIRPIRARAALQVIEEKKWDNTPEDEVRHDVTDEIAAYKLAHSLSQASSASSMKSTARPRTRWRASGSNRHAKRPATRAISKFSRTL